MIRQACQVMSLAIALCACSTLWAAEAPYTQTQNIVFHEVDGIGLLLDVFTPTGPSNGLAIVDVASGSWYSDRGKINDHKTAQMFDIFCGKGYTVFAVRPGSQPRFSPAEMAAHVKKGIAWVKQHADEYKIDPNRVGLTGASAGGHLASLVAVTADDKSAVKACGVFFPPTDFLEYGKRVIDFDAADESQLAFIRKLAFPNGAGPTSALALKEKLIEICPARLVTAKAPPFLLIHGDADPLVPLQQSEKMVAALKDCGVNCELIVKKGGGHPWFTINEEVKVMADWFDKQLVNKEPAPAEPAAKEAAAK